MELRKRKGNHTEFLADRMFYWLAVLVTVDALIAVLLAVTNAISSPWVHVMGLVIGGAVSWTVYLLHKRYVLPDARSPHMSAFLVIALLLFLCLSNRQYDAGLWNIFLIYPLYLTFFHNRMLLLIWGTVSCLIYAFSLGVKLEQAAAMDVFAHLSLAAGSGICAWLGYYSLNRWVGGARRAADERKREYAMTLLNELVPTVERKTRISSREIEQMGRLIKRMLREFPEEKVSDWEVNLLSLLHYVSRIKWPDYVFEKEGKLTTYEYQVIQEHCFIGTELFKDDPACQRVVAALHSHHERYDGTGYPTQLKANEIPVLAQALGIVECYLAMTTFRSYREPLTVEEACEQIRLMAGTVYDERVVCAFSRSIQMPLPVTVSNVPPMVG
ncbi:HD domain-containing phosphohydrolase [Brevibacillus borstelensis]|uniref:HD-GYP domain-containing protein n=1 Tax=Brevibacillus borstelensis TaxID=45462 RepID=UPI002E1CCA10|nr:HD domain-containing phosphohydrolase [Brevibacillus borstelensis]